MRKFVTINCLVDYKDIEPFPSDAIQNLRLAVLAPNCCRPRILQALQRTNFIYHRTCSYSDIIRDRNGSEGEPLLMFWGCERIGSKVTMSMSASSCSSSSHMPSGTQRQRERDLRSTAQQTDISCRYTSGVSSPVAVFKIALQSFTIPEDGGHCSVRARTHYIYAGVTETDNNRSTYEILPAQRPDFKLEEQRFHRTRIADSLNFSSPASSLLQPTGRSMSLSILGSVCALLLNKQVSTQVKEVLSITGSICSDNICRICFGGESAERLVQPCSCRGTIAAVHRACLERWLLQAATSYCELCRHHYIVTRTHKWSWMRSLTEWVMSGHGRALAADICRALALGAASVLGTARALHACDAVLQAGARKGGGAALAANLFSSLIIGIIGALNGLLTTWMLLKIQEHQLSWQTWRDSTLHVHVSLADEEETVTPRSSDITVIGNEDGNATADRSTNIADPFMVALPYSLSES